MAKKKKRKRRTTKYGEPIRKFNKKDFRLQNKFAYQNDAVDHKKKVKGKGYLARITPMKGGHKLWVRNTPKSRKWEKSLLKKDLREMGSLKSPSKKRKGTIRHEAFKSQQAKLHEKKQRKVKIESLKKSRKRKF